MDFKIISWNIRGLNDLNRRDIVKQKAREWKPSIFVLQETKIQECNDLLVWKSWGNINVRWIDAPSEGRSGGILCMWDTSKVNVIHW